MVSQPQSDATSSIKRHGIQHGNTYAGTTEFVLVCGCGVPADYVVDPQVLGEHRSVCRQNCQAPWFGRMNTERAKAEACTRDHVIISRWQESLQLDQK